MSGEGNPLGVVQNTEIWSYKQVVQAQPRICPGERDVQTSLGFWDTNRSHNIDKTQ